MSDAIRGEVVDGGGAPLEPWYHEVHVAPPDTAWPSAPGQAVILLLAGAVLGPGGAGILGAGAMRLLDPALAVALAALGIFVGLALRTETDRREPDTSGVARAAAGIIVALAVAAILFRAPSLLVGLGRFAQVCGIALIVGCAGWLLMDRLDDQGERRVFAIATIFLLGGLADALGTSALLAGLLAGGLLGWATPRNVSMHRVDIAYLQRPLTALLLVIGGAKMTLSPATLALAIGYSGIAALLALAVRRWLPGPAEIRIDHSRLTATLCVIALAIDGMRLFGTTLVPVMSAVALGTMLTELLTVVGRLERPR